MLWLLVPVRLPSLCYKVPYDWRIPARLGAWQIASSFVCIQDDGKAC